MDEDKEDEIGNGDSITHEESHKGTHKGTGGIETMDEIDAVVASLTDEDRDRLKNDMSCRSEALQFIEFEVSRMV